MDIENSILPWLGRTVKFMDLYIEDQLAAAGLPLTKLQFVFLMVISNHNNQPQNNLAELTGRDKTTFTRNLNTLEKKGLVCRKPSQGDKRIKLVCITELGKDFKKKSEPIIKKIISEVEEDISIEERESFKLILTKIRTKLILLRESNCTNQI
ncbi:MAG: DNA-binding MarR family transcriptional regulator [Salibacteraceae bacterium]|jgi:DNA-binding MarR family transcriptional regulator